jgi:hypothetical protein
MAITKQTAKRSTGGRAPREELSRRAARITRARRGNVAQEGEDQKFYRWITFTGASLYPWMCQPDDESLSIFHLQRAPGPCPPTSMHGAEPILAWCRHVIAFVLVGTQATVSFRSSTLKGGELFGILSRFCSIYVVAGGRFDHVDGLERSRIKIPDPISSNVLYHTYLNSLGRKENFDISYFCKRISQAPLSATILTSTSSFLRAG